ncbi:MAG: hypothetical protein ETSY1_14410 [Candidatus Entotheonella factor]|uniref:Uncharacterized protein n=1 Tax=Entotheonella factor TaxID=1429438 RepID=W4LPC9_ENTF1|nr:hypothetical protein [Candidatus Entotheonella palauensis]ETW99600.1 MAG: hypothetical protein ETSY1_14410 [Candidatus Entotheonella factor]
MLCHIALVLGVAYLGSQGVSHYRARQNKSWLLKPSDHLKRDLKPGSTRVYIVRTWQERSWLNNSAVTRYALEEPSTGRRYGFASAEALLEGLSADLARVQAMREQTEQSDFTAAAVPAFAV